MWKTLSTNLDAWRKGGPKVEERLDGREGFFTRNIFSEPRSVINKLVTLFLCVSQPNTTSEKQIQLLGQTYNRLKRIPGQHGYRTAPKYVEPEFPAVEILSQLSNQDPT